MIIDAHSHVVENGNWFDTKINASIQEIIRQMDETGIDKSVILPIININDNLNLYNIVEKYDKRLIMFYGINHLENGFLQNMYKSFENYLFKGIKIHPRLLNLKPLDKVLYPVYEFAVEKSVPIVFDGYANSNNIYAVDLYPSEYDKLAKIYPELKIIIAHLGGHRMWDAFFISKSNKNVYLDVSHILLYFKNTSIINDFKFFIEKLDRKLIYGTDFPECGMLEYYNVFKSYTWDIKKEKIENILGKNIQELMNESQ